MKRCPETASRLGRSRIEIELADSFIRAISGFALQIDARDQSLIATVGDDSIDELVRIYSNQCTEYIIVSDS